MMAWASSMVWPVSQASVAGAWAQRQPLWESKPVSSLSSIKMTRGVFGSLRGLGRQKGCQQQYAPYQSGAARSPGLPHSSAVKTFAERRRIIASLAPAKGINRDRSRAKPSCNRYPELVALTQRNCCLNSECLLEIGNKLRVERVQICLRIEDHNRFRNRKDDLVRTCSNELLKILKRVQV
jgi:hypothetical protein